MQFSIWQHLFELTCSKYNRHLIFPAKYGEYPPFIPCWVNKHTSEIIGNLQNVLEDFWCLLYAQHVKYEVISYYLVTVTTRIQSNFH